MTDHHTQKSAHDRHMQLNKWGKFRYTVTYIRTHRTQAKGYLGPDRSDVHRSWPAEHLVGTKGDTCMIIEPQMKGNLTCLVTVEIIAPSVSLHSPPPNSDTS